MERGTHQEPPKGLGKSTSTILAPSIFCWETMQTCRTIYLVAAYTQQGEPETREEEY